MAKEILSICKGISCILNGAEELHDVIDESKERLSIEIDESCCKSNCSNGPNITMLKSHKKYSNVTIEKLKEILEEIENI